MKRYLVDVVTTDWSGSGDNKVWEASINSEYYTADISKSSVTTHLKTWYEGYKFNTNEKKKVNSPNSIDKLILSIVYSNIFSSKQSHDETTYDIEHLATKQLMYVHLNKFPKDSLAISSIGNICLLPRYYNRSKAKKTIYQDERFDNEAKKHELDLNDIEGKYTFTTSSMLNWIEKDYVNFEELQKDYTNFIDNRFEKILDKVVDSLFDNKYI